MSAFTTSWTILLTLLQVQMAALNESTRNMTKRRVWFIDDINASTFKSNDLKDEVHLLQKFGQIYAVFIDQTERINKAFVMQLFIMETTSRRLGNAASPLPVDQLFGTRLTLTCASVGNGGVAVPVPIALCLHGTASPDLDAPPGGMMEDSSRLHAVFSKLSGVLPIREDLGHNHNPQKTMSSDIIESVLAAANDTPLPTVPTNWNHRDASNNANVSSGGVNGLTGGGAATPGDDSDPHSATIVNALAQRLEAELRRAKRTHLACGEVLLPCGLLRRIARDVLSMAECEPCGVRGCRLYVTFESNAAAGGAGAGAGAVGNVAEGACIAAVHWDPATPATHELYLTLRQQPNAGWQFLPQVIRNLTRGGTIVVSPAYTLSKKKLYRSYREE
ncbi:unnamed protein product [Callosobruchus maculatus]|uniref:Uncharacterized protein n=1 Tax=Callosobruchus maculatus TaxID=64391 RepID=A0A653BND3_CALMS|nr:unnamed protein product [Callosobruchus maculatus]